MDAPFGVRTCTTCKKEFALTPAQGERTKRGLSVTVCKPCYGAYFRRELGRDEEIRTNGAYRGKGSFGKLTTKERKIR